MPNKKPFWSYAIPALGIAIALMLVMHFNFIAYGPIEFFLFSFLAQSAAAAIVARQIRNSAVFVFGLTLAIVFELSVALGFTIAALALLAMFDMVREFEPASLDVLILSSKYGLSLLIILLLLPLVWRWCAPRTERAALAKP